MPITVPASARLSDAMSKLMYLQQMRNQPSAYDQLMEDQDKLERQNRLDAIKEESEKRQQARDQALQDQAEKKAALEQQKYGAIYGPGGFKEQESARQERQTESTIGLQGAEAGHAVAETGLAKARTTDVGVETQARRTKMQSDAAEAVVNNAQRSILFAQGQAMGDHQFSKDETDQIEHNYQLYGGDRLYKLDRNPDGGWKYDKTKLPMQMLDKDGQPTTKYAEGINKLNAAQTEPFREIQDYEKMATDPNTTPAMKDMGARRLVKTMTPSFDQFGMGLANDLLEAGAPDAAVAFAKDFHQGSGSKPLKTPTAGETTDMQDRLQLVDHMDTLRSDLKKLTDQGIIPTGHYRQKPLKLLADMELGNPEVQSFTKRTNELVSMYMKMMHGRRFQQHEVAWILKSMPSTEDSASVLDRALEVMSNEMSTDVRLRSGVLSSVGIQVPPGINPISPHDILKGHEGIPDIETSGSYMTGAMATQMLKGQEILRQKYMRQNIGGTGAFRDSSGDAQSPLPQLAPGQQLGQSTEKPGKAEAKVEGDVRRFKDRSDAELAKRQKELEKQWGAE